MRILLALLLTAFAFAQTSALVPVPRQQPLSNIGLILPGGCLYSFSAGTTTPQNTYSNSTLTSANTNPIVLDAFGRAPAIYWNGSAIKLTLANKFLGTCPNSPGTVIWSQDNIADSGIAARAALEAYKTLLASRTGAAQIGFEPTGGTTVITVATALSSFLFDSAFNSFSSACTAAHDQGKTLALTTLWTVAAGTYTCDVWFLGGGTIKPSAAGVVLSGSITAPPITIFDYSLSGAVDLTRSPSKAFPQWWGAKNDGSTDSAASIGYAFSASLNVEFPPGIYVSSTAQSITQNTQRFACQGPGLQGGGNTYLKFTGATNGVVLGDGVHQLQNVEIENCNFVTSNAGGGKAVSAIGTVTGAVLNNLGVGVTGAGAWTYGIYGATDFESSAIYRLYCYSVSKCVSMNGSSNAINIISPMIGGTGVTGIEARGVSSLAITDGTVQGSYSTALIDCDGGCVGTGIYLEQSGAGRMIESTGENSFAGMTLGGGSVAADAIWHHGTSAPFILRDTKGFVTAPGCVVRIDGSAPFGSGNPSLVTGGAIYNASASASSHALCVGVAATSGLWSFAATSVQLQSTGVPAVLASVGDGSFLFAANLYNTAATYAINATGFGSGARLSVNGGTVVGATTPCNGCTWANTTVGSFIQMHSGSLLPIPLNGTFSQLPACNAATTYIAATAYNITDSNTVTWGAAAAGGGTDNVLVRCSPASGEFRVFAK